MQLSRHLTYLAVLACAGALAACGSESARPDAAGTSAGARVTPSRSPAAAAGCPKPAELVTSMKARGWNGFRVRGAVVCDGAWATAHMQQTAVATDPARAVFRRTDRGLRALTYGTEGLCADPEVRPAPAKIKRALGVYC